jgi:hypothetical protein
MFSSKIRFSRLVFQEKQIVETVKETDDFEQTQIFDKINGAREFLDSRGIKDVKSLIKSQE